MIPPIIAPTRWKASDGREYWLGVSFTAGHSSNEPVTPSPSVKFIPESFKQHLNRIKQNLSMISSTFRVPSAKRERVESACPLVDLIGPSPRDLVLPLVLSTEEQRSWELAYALSCLAGADLGVWENRIYWATGQVNGDQISVAEDTLPAKLDFVFNQHGLLHFFVGSSSVSQSPADVTLTNATTLTQIFTDPSSPLSRQLLDPFRYSNQGVPTCLEDYLKTETFETRLDNKDELVAILSDPDNRLVLVSSPIGWGKTALVAKALREYASPVYVSDFKEKRQMFEAIDCLLDGIRVTDDESVDIESDVSYVATKLRSRLPSNTLLVFVNTSLNRKQTPSTEVQELIWSLLRFGFRCVVELWDLEGWHQREYLSRSR